MEQGGGSNEVVEEASPISSRPPANLEELIGGSSSRNRWPREETVALLRIRSEMDSSFRDATLKAPLWEHVSRKLLELGFKRSAKKCREKFENVQKYYKRTKETRGGRHDGKTYKFFSQLEAFNTPPSSSSLDVTPLSVANLIQPPSSSQFPVFPLPQTQTPTQPQPQTQPLTHTVSFTFSSHSSSTASEMESFDDDTAIDQAGSSSRKRKRGGKMTELFEGLIKQVIHKQAEMQQTFLEALEKREEERLRREEAWKRHEMSRVAREHELLSQERAVAASREAIIISLIQKITGHTIQLPTSLQGRFTIEEGPLNYQTGSTTLSSQPPPPNQPPPTDLNRPTMAQSQSQPIMAIPQQQILPPPHQQDMIMGSDQSLPSSSSSSRWPKAEILALIDLRSGMEPRYQDNVPKGLLWEEISNSMKKIGYNRNAKRCKEKWENINKYYKKVKESNKKRPQDAKTCPYFDRLDLLYRNKVLSGGGSSTSGLPLPEDQTSTVPKQSSVSAMAPPQGLGNINQPHGVALSEEEEPIEESSQRVEKPEDLMMREMMQQEESMIDEEDEMDDEEEELDEDGKSAAYEIVFRSPDNREGNGHSEPPFLTMVQ